VAIDALHQKLNAGHLILLDGATGTELERRGVPMHELVWSGMALETHPDVVRDVHQDYIAAGADIITTNTFATLGLSLRGTDFEDRVAELNNTGARLAKEARERMATDRPVWIAGSMSGMIGTVYWRDAPASHAVIRDSYREQAEALAKGGVDLLFLEMAQDPAVAIPAIEGARTTGLPVWVAFSSNFMSETAGPERPLVARGSDGVDRPFLEAIKPILRAGGFEVAGINHTDVDIIGRAVDTLMKEWGGPVSAYPNSGDWNPPNWGFDSVISPADFVAAGESWIAKGAQIVGGCCGIGPEHIRRLHQQVRNKRVPVRSPRG
jgi:methionine synthase I (cobalamin-dependent)